MRTWHKKAIICGLFLLVATPVFAQFNPPFRIEEEDGSPSVANKKVKVTNGTLTDNGDGTVSLSTAGGGGLSNVVEDTTPQAGGDFDLNGKNLYDASGDVSISDNVSIKGNLNVNNMQVDGDFFASNGELHVKDAEGNQVLLSSFLTPSGTAQYFQLSSEGNGSLYLEPADGVPGIALSGDLTANGGWFSTLYFDTATIEGSVTFQNNVQFTDDFTASGVSAIISHEPLGLNASLTKTGNHLARRVFLDATRVTGLSFQSDSPLSAGVTLTANVTGTNITTTAASRPWVHKNSTNYSGPEITSFPKDFYIPAGGVLEIDLYSYDNSSDLTMSGKVNVDYIEQVTS